MAALAHRVDRLWPDPAFGLELDDAFSDLLLADAPAGRPRVAINMVTSVDGRAQLDGTAEGLGSRADRRVMRLLRAGFDAVASGAGTLRATGVFLRVPDDLALRRTMRGQAPQPLGVIIAGAGAVPLQAAWFDGDERRILVVGSDSPHASEAAAVPRGTELLVAPEAEPSPSWVLQQLGDRGVRSLLLEGGPRTNAAFLGEGLIDDIFWTLGPRLVGNDALPMIAPVPDGSPFADHPLEGQLVSVHRHADELFLRYRFGEAARA